MILKSSAILGRISLTLFVELRLNYSLIVFVWSHVITVIFSAGQSAAGVVWSVAILIVCCVEWSWGVREGRGMGATVESEQVIIESDVSQCDDAVAMAMTRSLEHA